MKQITIGDKPLMKISQEDVLQIVVMQGCCPHLDYWTYPTIVEYDNTMFSDTVIVSHQSTSKEDGSNSGILVFFFNTRDLSYHYHREDRTEPFYSKRLDLKVIKFLIEKGYDVPIY